MISAKGVISVIFKLYFISIRFPFSVKYKEDRGAFETFFLKEILIYLLFKIGRRGKRRGCEREE